MDYTSVRRVGIIGAGVAGLSAARVLIGEGIDCTLYERGAALGGVWTEGYVNFGAQTQRELYELADWPLPAEAPDFTPGPMLQAYLEDYARHFDVFRHIRFSTPVVELRENSDGGWTIASDNSEGSRDEDDFDLVVIATGLFSSKPHLPDFPGRDKFAGEVMHVYEVKSRAPLEGKRVAIVGFGKSAGDIAVESMAVAAATAIIFRSTHWHFPAKLAGLVPFKWGMLGRLTSTLAPPHYQPSGFERFVHSALRPLAWLWWRSVESLLSVQFGLGSRLGTRLSLVPAWPIETGAFVDTLMIPRREFFPALRDGRIEPHRSAVEAYTENGLALANGDSVEADLVILATGWERDHGFLAREMLSRLGLGDDGFYLYRQMVHPDVPGLAFAGYAATFESMLTYGLQARWLGDLVKGRHALPGREEMRAEIAAMKAWKRRMMPPGGTRGALLNMHALHYHDQLMRDIGADPLRKKGVFAPLKEVFVPYEPRDYGAIVSGEWRAN